MKDIVKRIEESLEKKKIEELSVKGIAKTAAAGALGLAALANPLAALGVGAAALTAGLAGNAIVKKLQGKPELAKKVKTEYIDKNKVKIAKDLIQAFKTEPSFTTSLIGMGSTLNSIKDNKTKQDLAELFFILLAMNNVKAGPLFKKGMGTLTSNKDPYIAKGAKEAQKAIQAQLNA